MAAVDHETAATWSGQYGVTDAERKANRRVALFVPLLPLAFLGIFGCIAGGCLAAVGAVGLGVVVVVAGFILGGIVVGAGLLAAPVHVERLVGAHRVPDGTAPRVENLVEGLCATFGVAHPPLYVVEDPRINLAMIATPAGAVMVVTRGLLEGLDLMELEGVIAHGLAHLRLDAVRRGTLAATLPSFLGTDSIRHRLAGWGRLLRADEVAAVSVRYPVAIAGVLERCVAQPPPEPSSPFASERFARTRWLWFDPMPEDETDTVGQPDAPAVRAQALAEW
ncbi:MAG TPA: M48 family metalloprotease [Acidimicrobiales bacterium]